MPSDEQLEELKAYGVPDDVIERMGNETIRQELKKFRDEAERLKPFEAEVTKLKKDPIRTQALKDAGVDFAKLTKAEKEKVASLDWDGDKPSAEAVSAFVAEWAFPTTTPEDKEKTAQEQFVNQALGGGSKEETKVTEREEAMSKATSAEEVARIAAQYPVKVAT